MCWPHTPPSLYCLSEMGWKSPLSWPGRPRPGSLGWRCGKGKSRNTCSATEQRQPLLLQQQRPLPHGTTNSPCHSVYLQYCSSKAVFSSPQRRGLLPAIVSPNTFRPLSLCYGRIPATAKHKHYVPPSTNYSFQELQFYFGYKHTKVTFMLGKEEQHKRPQAEPLPRGEHSLGALCRFSSHRLRFPGSCNDIRAGARAKIPGAGSCWRDLLQSRQSRNQDSERERNRPKMGCFSSSWCCRQPTCSENNISGTTPDCCHPPSLQKSTQRVATRRHVPEGSVNIPNTAPHRKSKA